MVKEIFTFLFCSILVNGIRGQPQGLTPDSINNYFKNRSVETNSIEGIWDVTSTLEYYHYDTLFDVVKSPGPLQIAILKKENKFQSYNLSGAPYETEFDLTDVKGVYLYRIYFPKVKFEIKIQC